SCTYRGTMIKDIYFENDLIQELEQPGDVLNKWHKLGLIHADGTTAEGVPFYTRGTFKKILHVKQLIDLGYPLEDVQKIVRKIGIPSDQSQDKRPRKKSQYLTVGSLADLVGVSPRTIKYWEDKGIIEAELRSGGGFRLYAEPYVFICRLIKDLQLFGYSLENIKSIADLFREFLVINGHPKVYPPPATHEKLEKMLQSIHDMQSKMDLFKKGINRWEDLLKKKQKEIINLRNQNRKRTPPERKEK
ncbi:MAG: MerR family transcriptional regulator, partial [Candidatus Aminicenantes bacterium]|nr:MerR family transcriptional regulator [Candidatus Aminicenantes bacterium]